MNKTIELQDLGYKDYKQTWDYQETLFKSIVDTKIKNRREAAGLETKNYFLFVSIHMFTLWAKVAICQICWLMKPN